MKRSRSIKKILIISIGAAALCAAMLAGWVFLALSDLPDVTVLKHYRPAAASEVNDRDGKLLTAYFERKCRIWIPISSLPDIVIKAVVTAEDDTFFAHTGVNYKATWDALVHDMQKRRFARGGSTITQQMIKNVLLTKEKTVTRKLREYVLAQKAEELLTKRQILQIYLNEVEWGDNIYGIEAAARFYLDKHASDLSAAEAALLAGMLPNPHYYNPFKRPEKAKERQKRVLSNMLQARLVSSEDYSSGMISEVNLRSRDSGQFSFPTLKAESGRPCYQQALGQALIRLYGEQKLYRRGLSIKTSLEKQLQEEIVGPEDAAGSSPGNDVLAIIRDGQIRAIVCAVEKDTAVREKLSSAGLTDYDLNTLSIDSISRDQIILPRETAMNAGASE
jgi:penicillin-binding protein 1A